MISSIIGKKEHISGLLLLGLWAYMRLFFVKKKKNAGLFFIYFFAVLLIQNILIM